MIHHTISSYLYLFMIITTGTSQRSILESLLDFPIEPPENPIDIIRSNGYPAEEHEVVTEDGYILLVHRIPSKKVKPRNAPPVLVTHGLSSSSGDYVNLYPNISLGYVLSDAGYDVWLANSRGNTYNRRHINIDANTNPKKFYNFSWHEMGVYDNTAIIDYIINKTNNNNIFYIGYSQGGTSFYVTLSVRPEYNEKIRLGILLAPAGFETHFPIMQTHLLSRFAFQLEDLLDYFGMYNLFIFDRARTLLNHLSKSEANLELCKLMFILSGEYTLTDDQFQKEYVPLIARTTPSDVSIKQYYHYLQGIRSGKFRQFDYGPAKNLQLYGTSEPPDYNITKITAPVAVYYGEEDHLVSAQDVRAMIKILPNVVKDFIVPYKSFNHLDFIFGKDLPTLMYDDMLRAMKQY